MAGGSSTGTPCWPPSNEFHDGEDPDAVYAELYANSRHEKVEGD